MRHVLLCFCVLLGGLGGLSSSPRLPCVAGQATPPPVRSAAGEEEEFTLDVVNISLPVTVLNQQGRFIADLSQADFEVFENNRRQSIIAFQRRDGLPLNIAILMDTSTSVRYRLAFEREAITEFLGKLLDNRRDQASFVTFDDEPRIRAGFTNDFQQLARVVNSVTTANGRTALYDAIKQVCLEQMPSASTRRRAILLVTDGGDTASDTTLDEAISIAQRAEVTIYAISTKGGGVFRVEGNPYFNMDDRNLKRLCKETGGDVFFPSDLKQTKRAYDLAKDYLRNQYFLVYEPSETRNNKGFREIEVRVPKHRGARILTRRGYFPGGLATGTK
ncbi:VWA domain-containing protein [Chloracidobacterium validum]|uniref:VWA domain-containing protein n=1 Tax=Chloracidobacterium validum TaxID=2821543 RepID=A0ABX8B995_9BACT|nr:VWA domain-containing protein [Chloracidobacterium validum]QUW02230.1 VWA domain-containing protein [Chloracidobacterium validum]